MVVYGSVAGICDGFAARRAAFIAAPAEEYFRVGINVVLRNGGSQLFAAESDRRRNAGRF